MNQQVNNAIGGYEDCHPVNAPREYTREELVEVMAPLTGYNMANIHGRTLAIGISNDIISALEAIGAVKIKGGV